MSINSNSIPAFGVALIHELCPVCTTKMNEAIALPKQLTQKAADEMEAIHGKPVAWAEELCPLCQEHADEDCIALVGIEPRESSNMSLSEAQRTGKIIWLKTKVYTEMFNTPLPNNPAVPMAFISRDALKQIEFIAMAQGIAVQDNTYLNRFNEQKEH